MSPGNIKIGSSAENQDYWNGVISALVVSPQGMGGNTWKAIVSVPDASPNPFDSDALSKIFQQIGARSMQLLSEQDLQQLDF